MPKLGSNLPNNRLQFAEENKIKQIATHKPSAIIREKSIYLQLSSQRSSCYKFAFYIDNLALIKNQKHFALILLWQLQGYGVPLRALKKGI